MACSSNTRTEKNSVMYPTTHLLGACANGRQPQASNLPCGWYGTYCSVTSQISTALTALIGISIGVCDTHLFFTATCDGAGSQSSKGRCDICVNLKGNKGGRRGQFSDAASIADSDPSNNIRGCPWGMVVGQIRISYYYRYNEYRSLK